MQIYEVNNFAILSHKGEEIIDIVQRIGILDNNSTNREVKDVSNAEPIEELQIKYGEENVG